MFMHRNQLFNCHRAPASECKDFSFVAGHPTITSGKCIWFFCLGVGLLQFKLCWRSTHWSIRISLTDVLMCAQYTKCLVPCGLPDSDEPLFICYLKESSGQHTTVCFIATTKKNERGTWKFISDILVNKKGKRYMYICIHCCHFLNSTIIKFALWSCQSANI